MFWICFNCYIQQVSLTAVVGIVKSRAYGGVLWFGVFLLSKFDIGMATTKRNQMQCRQSCSWQLLICFEQTQILQVF